MTPQIFLKLTFSTRGLDKITISLKTYKRETEKEAPVLVILKPFFYLLDNPKFFFNINNNWPVG